MRKHVALLIAASMLILAAPPSFGYCQTTCRNSSSGETYCALGLDMVDCDVVYDCEWHIDCATCTGYWVCQGHCVGDRCLRA